MNLEEIKSIINEFLEEEFEIEKEQLTNEAFERGFKNRQPRLRGHCR